MEEPLTVVAPTMPAGEGEETSLQVVDEQLLMLRRRLKRSYAYLDLRPHLFSFNPIPTAQRTLEQLLPADLWLKIIRNYFVQQELRDLRLSCRFFNLLCCHALQEMELQATANQSSTTAFELLSKFRHLQKLRLEGFQDLTADHFRSLPVYYTKPFPVILQEINSSSLSDFRRRKKKKVKHPNDTSTPNKTKANPKARTIKNRRSSPTRLSSTLISSASIPDSSSSTASSYCAEQQELVLEHTPVALQQLTINSVGVVNDDILASIVDLWGHSLSRLVLPHSRISDRGFEALTKSPLASKLAVLHLSHHMEPESLTSQSWESLALLRSLRNLEVLGASSQFREEHFVQFLRSSRGFLRSLHVDVPCGPRIFHALKSSAPYLTVLILPSTVLDDYSVSCISRGCRYLERLEVRGGVSNITQPGTLTQLASKLPRLFWLSLTMPGDILIESSLAKELIGFIPEMNRARDRAGLPPRLTFIDSSLFGNAAILSRVASNGDLSRLSRLENLTPHSLDDASFCAIVDSCKKNLRRVKINTSLSVSAIKRLSDCPRLVNIRFQERSQGGPFPLEEIARGRTEVRLTPEEISTEVEKAGFKSPWLEMLEPVKKEGVTFSELKQRMKELQPMLQDSVRTKRLVQKLKFRYSPIRVLQLHGIHNMALGRGLKHLPHLRRLTLHLTPGELNNSTLKLLAEHCRELRRLVIRHFQPQVAGFRLPPTGLTSGIIALAKGCPDLEVVDIHGPHCIVAPEAFLLLAERCPRLRVLGLYHNANDQLLNEWPRTFKHQLHTLGLSPRNASWRDPDGWSETSLRTFLMDCRNVAVVKFTAPLDDQTLWTNLRSSFPSISWQSGGPL